MDLTLDRCSQRSHLRTSVARLRCAVYRATQQTHCRPPCPCRPTRSTDRSMPTLSCPAASPLHSIAVAGAATIQTRSSGCSRTPAIEPADRAKVNHEALGLRALRTAAKKTEECAQCFSTLMCGTLYSNSNFASRSLIDHGARFMGNFRKFPRFLIGALMDRLDDYISFMEAVLYTARRPISV